METSPTRHESFIVRFRLEFAAEGDTSRWVLRGQVEHAQTGQAWRFVELDELQKILDTYLQTKLDDSAKQIDVNGIIPNENLSSEEK